MTTAPSEHASGRHLPVCPDLAEPWRAYFAMANDADLTVVPLPSRATRAEHDRVRASNDRDQRLEREGKVAPHIAAAMRRPMAPSTTEVERIVDEWL